MATTKSVAPTEEQKSASVKIGDKVSFFPAAKETHGGFAYYQLGIGDEAEKVGCLAWVAFVTKAGSLNLQVIDHGGRAWTMADVPYNEDPQKGEDEEPLTGFATKFMEESAPAKEVVDSSGPAGDGSPKGVPSGLMKMEESPGYLSAAANATPTDSKEDTAAKAI